MLLKVKSTVVLSCISLRARWSCKRMWIPIPYIRANPLQVYRVRGGV